MITPIQSVKQMVKAVGLSLSPFLKSSIIYFVVYSFDFFGSNVLSTILKCAPIVCLMAFIFLTDFRISKEYRYHHLIMCGLFFSLIGDALLDYKKGMLFEFGMLAFAIAQIFYTAAFGLKPLRIFIGMIFYLAGGLCILLMWSEMRGILKYAVPLYTFLLLTMAWRSNARIENFNSVPQVLGGIGGVSFAISDTLIALNKFYTPIPFAQMQIMSTYYLAQLFISLSILDRKTHFN